MCVCVCLFCFLLSLLSLFLCLFCFVLHLLLFWCFCCSLLLCDIIFLILRSVSVLRWPFVVNRMFKSNYYYQNQQSSGVVWKSRWPSWAPIPNKPMPSVDIKQHSTNQNQSNITLVNSLWVTEGKRKVLWCWFRAILTFLNKQPMFCRSGSSSARSGHSGSEVTTTSAATSAAQSNSKYLQVLKSEYCAWILCQTGGTVRLSRMAT